MQYTPVETLYCKKCGLHFIATDKTASINGLTDYHILARSYDDYMGIQKKKSKISLQHHSNDSACKQFIGKKIHHDGKIEKYGDGHGIVTDFDGRRLTVEFISTGHVAGFDVLPQYVNNYHFNNFELESLLKQIAENNLKINNEKQKKEQNNGDKTGKYVYWTHGRISYPVYVCRGVAGCQWKDTHELESVTAYVALLNNSKCVPINVMYCEQCNRYFIREKTLDNYEEKFGILAIRPIYQRNINETGGFYDKLNLQSLLSYYGYKADAKSTDIGRQQKLVSIIEYGLMKKSDIINHLENLLIMNDNNYYHNEANKKRRRDLEFLNDYNIERQREIFGVIITRAAQYRNTGFL